MTDGNVPLHGEGGDQQRGGVHGQELAVDDQGTTYNNSDYSFTEKLLLYVF